MDRRRSNRRLVVSEILTTLPALLYGSECVTHKCLSAATYGLGEDGYSIGGVCHPCACEIQQDGVLFVPKAKLA